MKSTLAIAKRIAGDRATVSVHQGEHGHRAIRITGCFADEARAVAREIAAALPERRGGYPSVTTAAQFVAVWYR